MSPYSPSALKTVRACAMEGMVWEVLKNIRVGVIALLRIVLAAAAVDIFEREKDIGKFEQLSSPA